MYRFENLKNSDEEWIGKIPNHWEKSKIRFIGNLYGGLTGKKGDDFNNDENPNNKNYIPFTNIFNNTFISKNHFQKVSFKEGETQNKVEKLDLFFLMSSEGYEDLGKNSILIEDVEELYLNSFCKGYRVIDERINPQFLNYQLLGDIHRKLISTEGRGFTRINLRQDRLKDIPVLIPPLQEQKQIVAYLDTKTGLIDSLIKKKKRKIELLKEKRTSLFNEVITKGLDPSVKMKDSGIEWIGEIPEKWYLTNLRYYVKKVGSGSTPRGGRDVYIEQGVPFLRSQNIHFDGIRLDKKTNISEDIHQKMSGSQVKYEDVLLNITGGSIGRCCVMDLNIEANVNQHVSIVRTKKNKLSPHFLNYIFRSELGQNQVEYFQTGGNREGLTIENIKNFFIPIPPIKDQKVIVDYLNNHCLEIRNLIIIENKKIKKLKEYRQSLISEVVTGKIRVCEEDLSITQPIQKV
jgi:type I restriction enzyme, S subunit